MSEYRFGIQRFNNRYSTPNNLRGHKLSCESMNKTMKLKLKKIDEIKTSRSQMEMYMDKKDPESSPQSNQKEFFRTHSRIMKTKYPSQLKSYKYDSTQLHIRPPKKQDKKIQKPQTYYYSANLQEKMNLYLNNLINKSQQEHQQKLKQIQKKLQNEPSQRKTSYNTRNLFWKRMKRSVSYKKQKAKEEPITSVRSYSIKLDILS